MSLPRAFPGAFFRRLLFAPRGPQAPGSLRITEIASRESIARLVSSGRPLSKHLINGFIVHFRGLLETQADT